MLHRVFVVNPVDLRRLEQDVGINLGRPQGRGAVGGEEGVARPGNEDHHPALLQVPQGATTDKRLGHRGEVDGAEHPGRLAKLLEHLLERQAVDHRAEHAHLVGGRLQDRAFLGECRAADDVAATDHDRQLGAEPGPGGDLASDHLQLAGVDPEPSLLAERLATDLQEHPTVRGLTRGVGVGGG